VSPKGDRDGDHERAKTVVGVVSPVRSVSVRVKPSR
jgi:hypothetical protein